MSLTTNNDSLQEILASVNALPEAGSSGSGGFNACFLTLTIECYMPGVFYIVYTSVDDAGTLVGNYQKFYLDAEETETITANVLQGSTVGVISTNGMSMEHTLSPGATIVFGFNGGMEAIIQAGKEESANWTIVFG